MIVLYSFSKVFIHKKLFLLLNLGQTEYKKTNMQIKLGF